MVFSSLFSSKNLIGLDIGTTLTKAVELQTSKKGATLSGFGFCPTPPASIVGGEVQDLQGISTSVQGLVKQIGSRRKKIATGLWGTSVIVKKISMPKVDVNLLKDQVRWEAEQYIPLDINEITLDYHLLSNPQGGADSMDVLLVAAKTSVVFSYMELLTAAGLQFSIADVSGFALANCFEFNYGVSSDAIGLINMGASVSNFVVVQNGSPIFTRDIPVGGSNYNQDLQNEMGVSAEEAESLKVSASLSQDVPDDVHRIMTATTESIGHEIHNSFDFYAATNPNSTIKRLYLTGGCSAIHALMEHISKLVSLPAEYLDPLRKLNIDRKKFTAKYLDQIRPFLAVALGLALRAEGDRK